MAFNAAYLAGPVHLGGLGSPKEYTYDTTDTLAVVAAAGYFAEMGAGASPASSRGMEKGDKVRVRFYSALPAKTLYYGSEDLEVTAIDADGDVTVAQSGAVAVTATADGLTTGLIPDGSGVVAITSANVDHIVTLPAAAPGTVIYGAIAATGCEIRVPAGTINAVAAPNEVALAANSWFIAIALAAGEWVVRTSTKAGAWTAADTANA